MQVLDEAAQVKVGDKVKQAAHVGTVFGERLAHNRLGQRAHAAGQTLEQHHHAVGQDQVLVVELILVEPIQIVQHEVIGVGALHEAEHLRLLVESVVGWPGAKK